MENNLIYEYCLREKVAITFESFAELAAICKRFNYIPPTHVTKGIVSFYVADTVTGADYFRIAHIINNWWEINGYTVLGAPEFFRLSSANISILDYIR
jgi:hypothetical protein